MADQSIRITNLPDGGSPERVAYDLTVLILNSAEAATGAKARAEQVLSVYAACKHTIGYGSVDASKIT